MRISKLLTTAIAICSLSVQSFAIGGLGLHYLVDNSISLEDANQEQLIFEDIKLESSAISGSMPADFPTTISGDLLPVYVDRLNFETTPIHFGGKLFIDIIPILDAVELAVNFGVWQYEGSITYPTSITFNSSTYNEDMSVDELYTVNSETIDITLENLGAPSFFGLQQTPYARLNMDLTVRKNLLESLPFTKILRFYAGGGASMHFSTPVLSAGFIEDALSERITNTFSSVNALGGELLGSEDIMKDVVLEITKQLFTPQLGMHIIAGTQVKPPLVPIAIYLDGKLHIPFGSLDKEVEVKGVGVTVNAGIALAL